MGPDDIKQWVETCTPLGFIGVAWYLLKVALPAKDAAHAEERKAWEAANEKMWDTFRADTNARTDKFEKLIAETHDCIARLTGKQP